MVSNPKEKIGKLLYFVSKKDQQLDIDGASLFMGYLRAVVWNPISNKYSYKAILVDEDKELWFEESSFDNSLPSLNLYAFAGYSAALNQFKDLVSAG
jgi:hypothetical protein